MIMVAAISEFGRNTTSSRPPLLPSDRENGLIQHQQQQRRPRLREVPSRYMSFSSSSPANSSTTTSTTTTTTTNTSNTSNSSSSSTSCRRFPSPVVARNSRNIACTPKRSQSADRRRSGTVKQPNTVVNAGNGDVSAATKLLITSSRSLSVSFQGESFSLPISKTKAVNQGSSNSARKGTPERRRGVSVSVSVRGKVDGGGGDQGENPSSVSRPWPARNRQLNNMLSRSLDCTNDGSEEYVGSSVVPRALKDSFLDDSRRPSVDGILNLDDSNGDVLNGIRGAMDENSLNESSVPSDLTASETDSVSSGSTSGAQAVNDGSHGRSGARGMVVSARFWQETNMRLRRLQDPGLGLTSSPSSKFVAPSKLSQSRKFSDGPMSSARGMSPIRGAVRAASPSKLMNTPVAPLKLSQSRKFSDGPMSSPRAMSSPIRGAIRAASPSKPMNTPISSPMRGLSPSRPRSSIGSSVGNSPWDTPSVLSFAVDVRRGKVGENQIVDAHQLRLLHNRHLQWRFVNARADAALSVQKRNAEKNLWNAWITITGLRDSVRHKRTQVQLLRQKLKLSSILRGQMVYLEEWSLLDNEHSSSLQGAIEALKASTLRLPVVGGVTVDIQSVKEAVGSAVDVMHSMASSTCSLLTKVEEVNSLVAELSNLATKERILLEKCKEVLSLLAAMQVKDCSLRTHTLQLNRSQLA